MAGRARSVGLQPGQDHDGRYEAACSQFADAHGWPRGSILYWWSQIALAREAAGREPRPVAEYLAWRNVQDAFHELRLGRDPD